MRLRLTASCVLRLVLVAVPLGLLLSGCGNAPEGQGDGAGSRALRDAPDGPVVAVVNGETVTQPLFEFYARSQGLDPEVPAQRQQALDSLIEQMLLAQAALSGTLAQRVDLQAELALTRLQQLSLRQAEAFRDDVDVAEQELRDYYQREVERTRGQEFHVQHLLFADPADAAAALSEAMAGGQPFESLIAEYEGRSLQARDLGFANPTQMPPEFVEAVTQLEDGQIAPVVVQTRFGHHVLRLVERRAFVPPPFEQIRDGARQQLVNQALADRVRALRSTAAVTAPGASMPEPMPSQPGE
ncbi:MAG: peptidyl-prolyl cis-trans isomerase [Aquimonas sp.]|nr:peptidyl-prolyl cis-trans isomerase [Aquimonas sp.]